MSQGIIKRAIHTDGIVAELYLPPGDGPFPGVVCLGGSSGGVATASAPLLAQAGFAALSLGYFGAPGLPAEFAELPLEYFVHSVDWLLQQPMVAGPAVGVIGTSRGSEAALQVATLTPRVGAVVAYVPSGIRWMGVDGRPSWTYGGAPLPYVKWDNSFDAGTVRAKVDRFNNILDDPSVYAAAEILVEQAHCPILLISGQDDQLWPSERMADLIMKRLKRHNYAFNYQHIAYPNAGHRIKVPGLPNTSYEPVSEDTVTGELLELGGTYEGNKNASEQAWNQTLEIFRNSL